MILDFMKTKRNKEELKIAHSVIQEFLNLKLHDEDSGEEKPWIRLEQLEAMLACLIIGKDVSEKVLWQIEQSANIADIW